ncbi:helix-turn-helix transcriptional regulator [Microlunatus speluncae]|uniref:helix-turn-helix transcriptional regulator n=1 Tax=Microlunatus speluncae TaxID=2594267 RepID=UPI001C2D8422|nr:WYL domain-containing protein [Microlunatus speluncae]
MVSDTSRRALRLLTLLASRRRWPLNELVDRLDVSPRTVRRDVETLRHLDYAIEAIRGPGGGYQLGSNQRLPPLLFDDDQALAIAVSLQTAPSSVFGLGEAAVRALDTLKQVLPPKLRTTMDAMHLTRLHNYWDFAAPPIAADIVTTVGTAVRERRMLEFDLLRPDGTRPEPAEADFEPPRRIEPHHLVVWAGRWYVVAFDLTDQDWRVYRADRIHPHSLTGGSFPPRQVPGGSAAHYVMTTHDRGDTPAPWQCIGTVRIALPAQTVARWAPGGSVVEFLDPDHTRLTIGAWSWAGVAGILATFDADITELEPADLVSACHDLAQRWSAL